MTATLLPGVLRAAGKNVGHGTTDVAVFETGTVTLPRHAGPAPILPVDRRPTEAELAALDAALPAQPLHLALVATGDATSSGWWGEARPFSWADAVEAVRAVAALPVGPGMRRGRGSGGGGRGTRSHRGRRRGRRPVVVLRMRRPVRVVLRMRRPERHVVLSRFTRRSTRRFRCRFSRRPARRFRFSRRFLRTRCPVRRFPRVRGGRAGCARPALCGLPRPGAGPGPGPRSQ